MYSLLHVARPMMEATLTIAMPDTWVSDVCAKHSSAIQFHRCVPYGQLGGRSLIELSDDEEGARLIEDIGKHPSVERVEVSRRKDGRVTASVTNANCVASRALANSDCFLISARSLADGRVRWDLTTGQEGSLLSLVSSLRQAGCAVEVERIRKLGGKALTERQRDVLASAFAEGYYDTPKCVHLAELAKKLSISPSTLGEILQRAEKLVIEDYLSR